MLSVKLKIASIVLMTSLSYAEANQVLNQIDSLKSLQLHLSQQLSVIQHQIDSLKVITSVKKSSFVSEEGISISLISNAKLRPQPNTIADEYTTILSGTEVQVLEYTQNYYYVHFGNLNGYINEMYFPKTNDLQVLREKGESINSTHTKSEREKSLQRLYGKTNAMRILKREIWLGMSPQMARESIGIPNSVNKTVGNFGVHEQWVYPNIYLYFENSVLTSWQD